MKLTTKLGAAAALALGLVGALSAMGGSSGAAHTPALVPFINASNPVNTSLPANTPAQTPPVAPDGDNVQSGDTTTPDTPGQAPAPETTGTVPDAQSTPEPQSTPELPAAQGDGPGGHQDNGANTDHQFEGSE